MTIEERLDRVERELALLRGAAVDGEIYARVFALEAGEGRQYARLSSGPLGCTLTFTDEEGDWRLRMGCSKHGPFLDMFDTEGNRRVHLGMGSGQPALRLYDEGGREISIGWDRDGLPR